MMKKAKTIKALVAKGKKANDQFELKNTHLIQGGGIPEPGECVLVVDENGDISVVCPD